MPVELFKTILALARCGVKSIIRILFLSTACLTLEFSRFPKISKIFEVVVFAGNLIPRLERPAILNRYFIEVR